MGKGGILRPIVGGLLQLVGIAGIVLGCWLITPWLALLVGGVLLLALGIAVDPPRRPSIAVTPSTGEL